MTRRIERVEVWHCPLEMSHELHLGAITYRSRDYVVLRLTTDDGLVGAAIGYTRGTPVYEAVRILAGHLSGLDVTDPTSVARTLRARFAPGWGAMVRAASLIDIALWDIRARASREPLSASFGMQRTDVPLMAVAGYFLDLRGAGAVVDEVRRFVDEGYQTMKLIVPGHDLAADLEFVEVVASVLPSGVDLAIDFHGAFGDASSASKYCRSFADRGLRFIEDPLASYEISEVIATVAAVSTPIAAGEDVMSGDAHRQLVDGGVAYLRADATATGGYSTVSGSIAHATRRGAVVAPHVWPHIHMPLAAESAGIGMIELIPHHVGADPIDALLTEPFPVVDGRWAPPAHEGLYLPLDWDRAAASSDRAWAGTV